MAEKKPFAIVGRKVAASGTNDLLLEQVKDGYLWCAQHVGVSEATHNPATAQILLITPDETLVLYYYSGGAAGVVYHLHDPVFVAPRWRLAARFSGSTAGDELRMYVTGYVMRLSELE